MTYIANLATAFKMRTYFRPATFTLIAGVLLPLFLRTSATGGRDLLSVAGRGAAVVALSSLLVAAIVSVRVPRFDAWFGGLTRLWKIHHALGALSFLLVMAHPLLLAFAAARSSIQAAGAVLFPPLSAGAVWVGWGSFIAMALFLAPTFRFFAQTEYQKWKAIHAVSGLAVILGIVHAVLLGRSADSSRTVWLLYGSLAVVAFVYRHYIAPRTARRRYAVERVQAVNRGVVEITLRTDDELLDFRPGQFIYLTPLDSNLAAGCGEEHPYTVSSGPQEAALRIAIKDAGDATHALQTASVGSRAMIEGPYGDFFPKRKTAEPALWIAGGIGIAPFLSRARSLTADGHYDIHLIYCVQDESRAHFIGELEAIAACVSGLKITRHFYASEGMLTAEFIAAACPDFAGRETYLCGPPPFVAATKRDLRRHGVSKARIHTEDFSWL